jgi:hypothetical protein
MKKFVKMSLVAALAVAGTTASAQPLTEAIKNVDVSGTMVYRYNDYNDKAKTNNVKNGAKVTNYYKLGLSLKSKVNDDVTANTRFLAASSPDGSLVALDSQAVADSNVGVTLSTANFAYTGIANTTIIAGKQGLTTPWTVAVDSDSNEQTGTGILALTTVGPVTLAGAYFNQTNLGQSGGVLKDGTDKFTLTGSSGTTYTSTAYTDAGYSSRDIYTVGAMAKVGPVSLDAWYLDMDKAFDTYTLGANASFDLSGVTLGGDLRYTSLNLDGTSTKNDMIKATVTAKAGIINASVMYAGTNKQGGTVALDADATTGAEGWNLNANAKKDADYYRVALGAQVLPSLNISANYGTLEYKVNTTDAKKTKQNETYAQLNYSMSKNLSAYIRYGVYEVKDATSTKTTDLSNAGRLQIQYKF